MRFNGVDICSVHRAISVAKEIPPGMPERSVETVSGREGETLAGTVVKRGEYTVRVNIAGKSRAEAWRVRALLAAWAGSSGETTAELEPTHWPGMAYEAIVGGISPPEFTFGFAVVEITFVLPRPFAHEKMTSRANGNRDGCHDDWRQLGMQAGNYADHRGARNGLHGRWTATFFLR